MKQKKINIELFHYVESPTAGATYLARSLEELIFTEVAKRFPGIDLYVRVDVTTRKGAPEIIKSTGIDNPDVVRAELLRIIDVVRNKFLGSL